SHCLRTWKLVWLILNHQRSRLQSRKQPPSAHSNLRLLPRKMFWANLLPIWNRRWALTSCFFFQAEDGIRDSSVTGVQTCALPIYAWMRIQAWLGRAVVSPFYEMYERAGGLQLAAIAVFIVLFKFGDALAASMSNPLYVALEFTKVEVATISKVYGVIATVVGVAAGGLVAARIGGFSGLLMG